MATASQTLSDPAAASLAATADKRVSNEMGSSSNALIATSAR